MLAAAAAAASAALALAAGAAGAAGEPGAAFPCQVQVKGRQRGDPECTKTVWRIPKAEARRLGLRRRTVFRSCPSKRAQRRARRGKARLAAGNLPGGDDKVLAGFEESSVAKNGYLWSAVTYDDAGAPTKGVMRDAESTLIFAGRAPAEAATAVAKRGRRHRRHRRTSMMCQTGTDDLRMPGRDRVRKPEGVPPNDGLGSAAAAFEAGAPVAASCAGDATPQVKVLYELDRYFVLYSRGGCEGFTDAECVESAVEDATALTNLVATQYELQAGVELVNEVFIDTRENPFGATYPGKDSFAFLDNYNLKWRKDPELRVKAADYGLVHLLSGFPLCTQPDGAPLTPEDPLYPHCSAKEDLSTIGLAYVGTACEGFDSENYDYDSENYDANYSDPTVALAVSWLNKIEKEPDVCKVALIQHENGHTFSLEHVVDEGAVMYYTTMACSLSFKTAKVDGEEYIQDARVQVKDYVEGRVGIGGCSCSASTAPSPPLPPVTPPVDQPELPPSPPLPPVTTPPPPVPPVEFVSCEVFGRRKKRQCFAKGSGKCIFQKKGKWCLPSPSNGGKCTDYWKRKTCIRAGPPCEWSYRAGGCVSAAAAEATGE